MSESILSPNQSAQNQNILDGELVSPKGLVEKGHQANIHPDNDETNAAESVAEDKHGDKENGPNPMVEASSEESIGSKTDDTLASSPPKRAAEDQPEDSGSDTKKARFVGEESEANTDDEKTVAGDEPTSPALNAENNEENVALADKTTATAATASGEAKASSTAAAIQDLLEKFAKDKETIQKTKETLKELKEQQQALVLKEEVMATKLESFDQGLTNLKRIHEDNRHDLEEVLALREVAKEKFDKAAEILRAIEAKEDKVEGENENEKPMEVTSDETVEARSIETTEGVDAGVVVWKRESSLSKEEKNTTDKELIVENPGADVADSGLEAEMEATSSNANDEPDVIVWKRENSKVDAENQENLTKEEENSDEGKVALSNIGTDDAVACAESEQATSNSSDDEIDDTETSKIDGALVEELEETEDPDDTLLENDDEENATPSASQGDSAVALELQNDEKEADDDDSLVSM